MRSHQDQHTLSLTGQSEKGEIAHCLDEDAPGALLGLFQSLPYLLDAAEGWLIPTHSYLRSQRGALVKQRLPHQPEKAVFSSALNPLPSTLHRSQPKTQSEGKGQVLHSQRGLFSGTVQALEPPIASG